MSPPSKPSTCYTQSGPLFHSKTRALHKALQKSLPNHSIDLSYPTGPISLSPSDIPGYNATSASGTEQQGSEPEAFGWWRRKDIPHPSGSKQEETEITYTGLQEGLDTIAQTIQNEGPFDGVLGFSQGACAAAVVASLLEPGRQDRFLSFSGDRKTQEAFPESFVSATDPKGGAIQPPLKFAIIYSGFRAPGARYAAFYDPPLSTPTLHFLGAVDCVVEEARSRALIEVCEDAKVVVHPGGHFLPSQRPWLDAAVGFVRECLESKGDAGGANGDGKGKEEERVEDMDVPF
ncbi:MAG: hypothetical protein Q9201_002602 [Fulgogasparrea decipioides]